MKNFGKTIVYLFFAIMFVSVADSCKKGDPGETTPPVVVPPVIPPVVPADSFDIDKITDTYESIAPFANYKKWTVYNVHDPSIIKVGDLYYSYSTDVGFGVAVRSGIQVRKSKDLVEWEYVGWVFNSLPPKGSAFITQSGGTPFDALWAPYLIKSGSEFRLYYSLSSPVSRLSVIGLATSNSPEGPWVERDIAVASKNDNTPQTNAIDPTVIITPGGEHWMHYGSAYDGIYALKLDPATGLALTSGDKGVRIAQRGFTGNTINGNIEGPEIIYNATLNKYFIFIAYDWLQTKYNVRVGRGDNPNGPFFDFNGKNINTVEDHGPMILAPYKFEGHSGWQGTAHCSVFKDDVGQYYMAHQARPGVNSFFMNLHVRKIFWTDNGWPIVSPERYAWEDNAVVAKDSIPGQWEMIKLNYNVVPGFDKEQLYPDFQNANPVTIDAGGTVNNGAGNTWTYTAPWLTINWSDGTVDKVLVQKGRDWENKKPTHIFTGLNNSGIAVWGKKK